MSRAEGAQPKPARLGIEMVFNLLAPSSPNHYFLSGTDHHPLEFRGELAGSRLSLIDEQQRIEITLEAPRAAAWWVVPIETVSQSESGFERIYQGSAIMPVWDIDRELSCALRVQVAMRP
ncbi:MAG: alpha-amylase/4-alpha-glucanotransferase domain-containing protein [Terriglobia bacterium]